VKPLDWFFLVASLVLTVTTAGMVFVPTDAPLQVQLEDPEGTFVFPLDQDRVLEAKGPLGVTTIHIVRGGVFVSDSPCTNKICIEMGTIHTAGQFVACLPNRIFVRIVGGTAASGAPDATAW